MKNLKALSLQLSEDLNNNTQWFEQETSFVIDGCHTSGQEFNEQLKERLDITKKNFGKRGANIVAFAGNTVIQDIYNVNSSQGFSIWKYLNKDDKATYDKLIRDLLINMSEV